MKHIESLTVKYHQEKVGTEKEQKKEREEQQETKDKSEWESKSIIIMR